MKSTHAINFSWILKLRWGSIGGQLAVIALVRGVMGLDGPIGWLLAIVLLETASNVWLRRWSTRHPDRVRELHLAVLMMSDVVVLTALLALAGGSFNPFSSLYLVHVALAAVILTPRWTWTLVALAVASFGALFLVGGTHAGHHAVPDGGSTAVRLHLYGMWLGFGLAAAFIVYFIQRVRRALAERDRDLEQARDTARRGERLASLATLAAGAAHELASPLSTIAVAAKELEHALARSTVPTGVSDDARLIREQVDRCRDILDRLAADAGQSVGEGVEPIALAELVDEAGTHASAGGQLAASVDPGARGLRFVGPRRALVQAIGGLIKNAVQASAPGSAIELRASVRGDTFEFEVEDHGAGMTPEVLARAGEPFFTTKPPSGPARGMGLGLFLARAVAERLGGGLEIDSTPGRGTTARLRIRPTHQSTTQPPP